MSCSNRALILAIDAPQTLASTCFLASAVLSPHLAVPSLTVMTNKTQGLAALLRHLCTLNPEP